MVFLSSMGALQGAGIFASYFAAKAWDWIFGEGLWAELQGTGVDVVSYVIGATQGDNFHLEEVRSRPAVTGEDPSLQGALDRVRNPVTADFVARQLFEILPKEPTVYPNEAEAKTAQRVLASSRRDAVLAMNKLTTANWG
jgi:short-subunit dehydrogenase